MPRDAGRPRRPVGRLVFVVLFLGLILVRLPSLAEPAGADQGLYAYVGQRILAGGWPYGDAWDQKPPAIHATYALMVGLLPAPLAVNVTDLAVAAATALLLLRLGRALDLASGAGETAALLFLFISNPAFGRLGGVRVRGQCEVFIALAVTAGFLVLWHVHSRRQAGDETGTSWRVFFAGLLFGLAATYKYNAVVYAVPAYLTLVAWPDGAAFRTTPSLLRRALILSAGIAAPLVSMIVIFAAGGLLRDLIQATIAYNVAYSGETYGGLAHFLVNLIVFPVQHARLDSLWWLGGLGCVVLLVMSIGHLRLLVVPVWVAAGCLAIAINGSRGLPQYFLQVGPPLALAAGLMLAIAWRRFAIWGRVAMVVAVSVGVWRVTTIPKAIDYTSFDLAAITGRIDRDTYLARFGESGSDQKYSASAMDQLAEYLRRHSAPDDPVFVFGFSPGALVSSERVSASRFFWSRPVIVGFQEGTRGYGAKGLLEDLQGTPPKIVVLQQNDWQDTIDSASFFLEEPGLSAWLKRSYRQVASEGNYLIWQREEG
jgi:hypothetical protein